MPATVLAERVGLVRVPGMVPGERGQDPAGVRTSGSRGPNQLRTGVGEGVLAFAVHHGPDAPVPDDRGPAGRDVGAYRVPRCGAVETDPGQRNRHRPAEQLRRRRRCDFMPVNTSTPNARGCQ